jgi:predicted transcriptional regulator
MALEEEIMQHRMLSEKIQVMVNALASGAIKNEVSYTSIEDILTKIITEDFHGK